MPNRIPKDVKLKGDKDMRKEGRGSIDFVSDGKVIFIKWFDNKPVYMISTNEGIGVCKPVKRWCKKEKNSKISSVDSDDDSDYKPPSNLTSKAKCQENTLASKTSSTEWPSSTTI
ncbi:hypothetical protein M8J75_011424 [Diaphorina citri]|nr:hypothetical protein M8J75_011424 [Diaphorina citri]